MHEAVKTRGLLYARSRVIAWLELGIVAVNL
jgi:hypothetical protein